MTGKYNNRYVKLDGYTFDSKAEATRYGELKILLQAGKIKDLEVHPSYPIKIDSEKICITEMDFYYYDNEKKQRITEDVKGFDPPLSKLKRKLLKALYPELNVFILAAR